MVRTSLIIVVTALIFVYVDVPRVQSLKIIPQKLNITYKNPKYIGNISWTIKRYGRKSDYYVNLETTKYHTWGNNVSCHMIFYEYLHNEYRRSFVEISAKVCDLLNNDLLYIGRLMASYGIKCPISQREIRFMNMTLPTEKFPYEFPFERARVDYFIFITETGERVIDGHAFILFKNNIR